MRVDTFTLKTLWTAALRDLPFRKASFFVTSLLVPGIVWCFGAALAGVAESISLMGLGALVGLGVLGVSSCVAQARWKSRGGRGRPSSRMVVSLHQAYYSIMILLLSFYGVIFALQVGLRVRWPWHDGVIALYALSAVAGLLWAPHSLPTRAEDVALAAKRDVRWLPWVFAIQGSVTSLGVFLGVWISRGSGTWAYFLVMGLGTLLALITVTLGLSMFYRLVVMLFNPPPVEAFEDAGVRP